jgi:hypothetical protein
MTKLWQYTEAQAEAMSATNAAKVLAEQEQMEEEGNAVGNDELFGYALEYDDKGELEKDSKGNYVPVDRGYDVPEAGDIWRHLSKIYSKEKMMKIKLGDAESLHPEVKKILEKKVDATIGKFKSDASAETKAKYNAANEATKMTILGRWLKSKGHPSMDAGRRKTRKTRKGRRTTRKH